MVLTTPSTILNLVLTLPLYSLSSHTTSTHTQTHFSQSTGADTLGTMGTMGTLVVGDEDEDDEDDDTESEDDDNGGFMLHGADPTR